MRDSLCLNAPVAPSERILSLDVLRGFSVLGILIMNMQSFSMIEAAYINPTAYGSLAGLNRWVSVLSHILADQKFMTIFSILYGAGILMLTERAESKGGSAKRLHYVRTFWLIVFGMLHAYLLWYGDILSKYGICALLVFLFRKAGSERLLVAGLIVFSVTFWLLLLFGWSVPYWPEESHQETLKMWKPAAAAIEEEVTAYQGGWLDQMSRRVPSAIMHQTLLFLIRSAWRIFGLMLIGMALYKWGMLTAQRSRRFYLTLIGIGYGVGFPLVAYGVIRQYQAGWAMEYSLFHGQIPNYWGGLFVGLGYIGTVMLVCKATHPGILTKSFAAVGRMAFTNYLVQTFICTTLFYGHGFGLFGQVDRTGQILIVVAIWILQLIASPIWLRLFRFGPVEWLWRSLTYRRLQPMRV